MKVLKSFKKITSNKLLVKTFKISSSSFLLNYIGQKIVTLKDTDGFQH